MVTNNIYHQQLPLSLFIHPAHQCNCKLKMDDPSNLENYSGFDKEHKSMDIWLRKTQWDDRSDFNKARECVMHIPDVTMCRVTILNSS